MRRAVWISKRVVDPLNSVAWYAMDALWLAQLAGPAYLATALTLGSGALLVALDRSRGRRLLFSDLGLNCWMWMNALWMLSDLGGRPWLRYPALGASLLGAIFLVLAAWNTNDPWETLRGFRRLRLPSR